ncbi:hypothetical protein AKJ16_DCAP21852 [Drosera capensis]
MTLSRKLAFAANIDIVGRRRQGIPHRACSQIEGEFRDTAQLTIIKKAGHLFNAGRSDEFNKHLKAFLIGHPPAKSVGNPPLPVDGKVETNGACAVSSETKTDSGGINRNEYDCLTY